jgi:aminoglycoside phosphotransferase family enzyme
MVERTTPRVADGGAYAPAIAETHSGLVFFVGDRAYKLKKAVDLGFLDFTSREQRLAACQREVALNRRLSPDVYLGVADVLDASGEPCEHLVVMRRMPANRRLSKLVVEGAPVEEAIDDLAEMIARFHATAEHGPEADRAAGRDALAGRWAANTNGLEPFAERFVDGSAIEAVDALARRYLAGREPLLAARVAAGRACDGHGDLLADDISSSMTVPACSTASSSTMRSDSAMGWPTWRSSPWTSNASVVRTSRSGS